MKTTITANGKSVVVETVESRSRLDYPVYDVMVNDHMIAASYSKTTLIRDHAVTAISLALDALGVEYTTDGQ